MLACTRAHLFQPCLVSPDNRHVLHESSRLFLNQSTAPHPSHNLSRKVASASLSCCRNITTNALHTSFRVQQVNSALCCNMSGHCTAFAHCTHKPQTIYKPQTPNPHPKPQTPNSDLTIHASSRSPSTWRLVQKAHLQCGAGGVRACVECCPTISEHYVDAVRARPLLRCGCSYTRMQVCSTLKAVL